jgi:hypothetical protein
MISSAVRNGQFGINCATTSNLSPAGSSRQSASTVTEETGVKSSAKVASRRNGTSAPNRRAISAISRLSVLTTTRSNKPLSSAAARVYAMSGFPARGRMFLPGIRFEPPRAGMIAMMVVDRAIYEDPPTTRQRLFRQAVSIHRAQRRVWNGEPKSGTLLCNHSR